MTRFAQDIRAQLRANRTLAIQVNPRPAMTHTLTVVRALRLVDDFVTEGYMPAEWAAILDHWDHDGSTALGRNVVYIAGDTIEVDRFEAADLLTILPSYFTPADALTQALADALARGDT